MPLARLIIGEHLRSHPAVTAHVGARSAVSLSSTLPAIRYALVYSQTPGPEEWRAHVQVECWADVGQDETCDRTARAVVASLPDIPGESSSGYVVGTEVTNVFTAADPDTDQPRVIVLVTLLLYATDLLETP